MATLSVREIEQRVTQIAEQDEFGDDLLFDLLLAYGRAQSNVTRLRNGSYNVAEDPSRDYAQKQHRLLPPACRHRPICITRWRPSSMPSTRSLAAKSCTTFTTLRRSGWCGGTKRLSQPAAGVLTVVKGAHRSLKRRSFRWWRNSLSTTLAYDCVRFRRLWEIAGMSSR